MPEDYDDEDQGSESDSQSLEELQKKLAALEKDNKKYRDRERSLKEEAFVTKYGEEIAAEVADLPDDKREAWAEKLKSLSSKPEQTEPAPEKAPNVEVPPGLAAVTNAPATGTPDQQYLTPDEFQHHVNSMGLVAAAQQYGHLVKFPGVENPLATGQAADVQGAFRPPAK